MPNQNLDNILKDNKVDVAKNSLSEGDRQALKNIDKASLKTQLDNIKIEGANIKDVVLAIGANGDSFSNGGWTLNSLETKGINVNGKLIKIGQKSEAMILIQSFLQANGQQLNKYGADAWMGGETQGAAYRFYIENGGNKNAQNIIPNNPKNKPEQLSDGDVIELKRKIDGLSYSALSPYITTPDQQQKFSWAVNNNILSKGKLQSTSARADGYYTIDGQTNMLKISVLPTNKTLNKIKGKTFDVDLSNCIIKTPGTSAIDIKYAEFTQALYTTINEMHDQEVLGADLQKESGVIETEYESIINSTKSNSTKFEEIDKLIVRVKALKKRAQDMAKSSSTGVYDGFIIGRSKDIIRYTEKSREYRRAYVVDRYNDIYKNNKTKQSELSKQRIDFLTKENKELSTIKNLYLPVSSKTTTYKGFEKQYEAMLKLVDDNLARNIIEKPYVETSFNDNVKLTDFETRNKQQYLSREQINKLNQEIKAFSLEFRKPEHKTMYTNYNYQIKGISIGAANYSYNEVRIQKLG